MLDKRFKYSLRLTSPFYIFRKNKRSDIFYVRFKNGKTVSTRETTIQKAYEFALNYKPDTSASDAPKKTSETQKTSCQLKTVLSDYFVKGSVWVKYDAIHGSIYNDVTLRFNHSICVRIAGLLSDVLSPAKLTKSRLHRLQEQLLDEGLSGKTVNNYLSVFHKVYKQLIDKEIVQNDPFVGLRNCYFEKQRRTCFPIQSFKGYFGDVKTLDEYDLLSYCAIVTGARRAELMGLELSDITDHGDFNTLRIRGTKSVYSDRIVPLGTKQTEAIKTLIEKQIATSKRIFNCPQKIAGRIGYSEKQRKEEGIVFHSFRKMYKTILTAANLNTTLVETLMGHSTNNQSSNDVERIYFVAEKADMAEVYKKVISSFDFLDKKEKAT